jgi:hypothetical protein
MGGWRLRTAGALAALVLVAAACGDDDGGSSSDGDTTDTTAADAGETATTDASPGDTSGGGGGGTEFTGENGKITYEITGDYEASGEMPFAYVAAGSVMAASTWLPDQSGWSAFFSKGGDSQEIIQLNTTEAGTIFNFGNPEVSVTGVKESGCTFTFDQNDENGFKGTVECTATPLVLIADAKTGTADVSATFEGHK